MIILTMIIIKCYNVLKQSHTHTHVLVNEEIKSRKPFACAHIPQFDMIKCTSIGPLLINEIKTIEAIWLLSFGRWPAQFYHLAVIFNLHIDKQRNIFYSNHLHKTNLIRTTKQTSGSVQNRFSLSLLSAKSFHTNCETILIWCIFTKCFRCANVPNLHKTNCLLIEYDVWINHPPNCVRNNFDNWINLFARNAKALAKISQ